MRRRKERARRLSGPWASKGKAGTPKRSDRHYDHVGGPSGSFLLPDELRKKSYLTRQGMNVLQTTYDPHVGERIGEANKPGPFDYGDIDEAISDWQDSDAENVEPPCLNESGDESFAGDGLGEPSNYSHDEQAVASGAGADAGIGD